MAKCLYCGVNEVIGKAKTCSSKCRKAQSRTVTNNTNSKCDTPSVTSLENCQYCGKPLPALQNPRQHPGACYPCAIEQPSKPRDCSLTSTPAYHTNQKLMTVMERLFYRPASQLKPGEHNFVSLPGRACHGVH